MFILDINFFFAKATVSLPGEDKYLLIFLPIINYTHYTILYLLPFILINSLNLDFLKEIL